MHDYWIVTCILRQRSGTLSRKQMTYTSAVEAQLATVQALIMGEWTEVTWSHRQIPVTHQGRYGLASGVLQTGKRN